MKSFDTNISNQTSKIEGIEIHLKSNETHLKEISDQIKNIESI